MVQRLLVLPVETGAGPDFSRQEADDVGFEIGRDLLPGSLHLGGLVLSQHLFENPESSFPVHVRSFTDSDRRRREWLGR